VRRVSALVLVLLLGASFVAKAAPERSISHSDWLIAKDHVTVKVFLPAEEMSDLVGKAFPMLSTENMAKYLLAHLAVASGGTPCPAIDQGYDIGKVNSLSSGASLYAFELVFRCAAVGRITLSNTLLQAEHADHIDYARIGREGELISRLFTRAQSTMTLESPGKLQAAPASMYASLGARHVVASITCLLLLLALAVLLPFRVWAAGAVSLLAGYLGATLLGLTRLVPEAVSVQCSLGFVLVLCALLLAYPWVRRPRAAMGITGAVWLLLAVFAWLWHKPTLAALILGFGVLASGVLRGLALGGGWPLLVPPALFGFLDGLTLAQDFVRLQQVDELSVARISAFNAGALLGDVLVLAAAALLVALLRKSRWLPPASLIQEAATTAFAGFGAYWLLSPLF
jgi:hypothetical protein